MNEQGLLEKIRRLPPDQRQAAEHFIEGMEHRIPGRKPRHNPIGLCADLSEHITAGEIDEARREMYRPSCRESPQNCRARYA
jgi:hypothetical protein